MVVIIITVWIYYFLEIPKDSSINDHYLVSPADGLVIDISEQTGPIELQLENTTFTKLSIFMNVFNCHVNSTPFQEPLKK